MDWFLNALPWIVGGLSLALALAALRRPLFCILHELYVKLSFKILGFNGICTCNSASCVI